MHIPASNFVRHSNSPEPAALCRGTNPAWGRWEGAQAASSPSSDPPPQPVLLQGVSHAPWLWRLHPHGDLRVELWCLEPGRHRGVCGALLLSPPCHSCCEPAGGSLLCHLLGFLPAQLLNGSGVLVSSAHPSPPRKSWFGKRLSGKP